MDSWLSENVQDIQLIKFVTEAKKNGKVKWTAEGKALGEEKIQRGIFEGV